MKITLNFLKIISHKQNHSLSFVVQFLLTLAFSWLYAITAQMILPLYPVVITVLPLPIYLMIYSLGFPAAGAFILYLVQGILGAPFFAYGRSGVDVLVGPSGGYLMGMALVAVLLAMSATWYKHSWRRACLMYLISEVMVFGLGLVQLSFFVAPAILLATGLYPFFFGEVLKVIAATLFVAWRSNKECK